VEPGSALPLRQFRVSRDDRERDRPSPARPARSIEAVAERLRAGDDQALGAVRAAGRAIGAAIASLTGAWTCGIVVMGTAAALGEPWFAAHPRRSRAPEPQGRSVATIIADGGQARTPLPWVPQPCSSPASSA
jgi:hypothetical protein